MDATDKKSLSEQDICTKYITPAIVEQAGWDLHTQIRQEVYFTKGRVYVRGKLVSRGKSKRADYILYYKPNIPIAVIEAKDNNHSIGSGMQQALVYGEMLDIPFVYSSNGDAFLEHDYTVTAGQIEKEIPLNAFPSPEQLWQRYCIWKGLDNSKQPIVTQDYYNDGSSKVPRYYQVIAINRTIEAIAKGENRILLVMATGTGKTYTAFQIIWRLWKSKTKKRILFLADLNILVDQTKTNDFKPFGSAMTKIKFEKEYLVKENKIRKTEPTSSIPVNLIPYILPKEWKWCKWNDVALDIGDVDHKMPQEVKDGIPYVSPRDFISHNRIDFLGAKKISLEDFENLKKKIQPQKNDIIFPRYGTIGENRLVVTENVFLASYSCAIVKNFNGFIEPKYSFYYSLSLLVKREIERYINQTTQANVGVKSIKNFVFPLPPLSEQHRIVTKVDELMSLCDKLEERQKKKREARVLLNNAAISQLLTAREPDTFAKHWQRICDNFDLLYSAPENIGKLRQTILQLAVMGKLVPQDPNDEPASVLLDKIKFEKEWLIKEGKTRQDKPLPAIKLDEVPFELPTGWAWVRFPELGNFGRGKSKHRPRNDLSLFREGTYPVVQTGDVARANHIINTYTGMYNEKGLAQSRLWTKGTLCITIAANIADAALLGFDACFPDSVVGFIPSTEIGQADYFAYFMRTAKEHLQNYAPSTAQKNINLGILEQLLIPLPPKKEIKRIVTKVEELMSLCDELEAKLTQSQTDSAKLMDAAVRQMLVV